MLAALIAGGLCVFVMAGCGPKEDKPPSNYYTGPMEKKKQKTGGAGVSGKD